jgi:two-component system cell cycle sensor histidine kinase/response regulator CckA
MTKAGLPMILVVEDETLLRKVVADTLLAFGYEVMVSQNARETRVLIQERRASFRLVLLDMELPDCTGRELLQDIKRHCPQAKVIVMSGTLPPEPNLIEEQEIITDWLSKPFSLKHLISSVQRGTSCPPPSESRP